MWQRWNGTSHVFEKSDDNGSSWAPLPLSALTINEGALPVARLPASVPLLTADNIWTGGTQTWRSGGNPNYQWSMNYASGSLYFTGFAGTQKFLRFESGMNNILCSTGGLQFINSAESIVLATLLDSGKLGLGVSPVAVLDVRSAWSTQPVGFRVEDQNGYGVYVSNENTLNFNYGFNGDGEGWINFAGYQNGSTKFRNLNIGDGKGVAIVQFIGATHSMLPGNDNTSFLGYTSNRWIAVYAVNGAIQTSDARSKHDVKDSKRGLDFIARLRPVEFEYNDLPGRRSGLIAQEVIAAMGEDSVDGIVLDSEDSLGMNYASLTVPLVKAVQELKARLDQLER